jgi:hypothetical protein
MQPRAFVIMPFGQKPSGCASGPDIDFDSVYRNLLEPALRAAGCDVIRADQEVGAGDIRTDMFFELVTADLVVADITIHNPNVFYELGVRDGVCPRGIFLVNGDKSMSRPFDIASDRSFDYDIDLVATPTDTSEARKGKCKAQCDALARRFEEAIAVDRQVIGSPVYSHLPGLKPVNWDNIQTPRAKYLNGLQVGWHSRIRTAQANGQPGDIVTLAMNAPTRLHEARILYEAAIALMALSRHRAAERVLRDVIRLDPDNADAQIELAIVLCHVDKSGEAEQQLRQLSLDFRKRPQAADSLGQVLRHLWHLSWRNVKQPKERRQKAIDASQVALSAVDSFLRAHHADPTAYFAGFNALMLLYLLKELGVEQHGLPARELQDLCATTRYVAEHQRQAAIESGRYDNQFWTTTTLAGIVFMEGHPATALKEIEVACAIPAATSFQLQTFRYRLELLEELGVQMDFVNKTLSIVDRSLASRNDRCTCERVFLWRGCPIDKPGQLRPRFPLSQVGTVEQVMADVLKNEWKVGRGDLALCGGTSESDVIFAEICLGLGAAVRFMLRKPEQLGRNEPEQPLWPFADRGWRARFQRLLSQKNCAAWFDTDHLGSASDGLGRAGIEDFLRRRQSQWLINTAEMEAEPTIAQGVETNGETRLHGLFLSEASNPNSDADDTSFLMRRVNEFDGYRGRVRTIDPLAPATDREETPLPHAVTNEPDIHAMAITCPTPLAIAARGQSSRPRRAARRART